METLKEVEACVSPPLKSDWKLITVVPSANVLLSMLCVRRVAPRSTDCPSVVPKLSQLIFIVRLPREREREGETG